MRIAVQRVATVLIVLALVTSLGAAPAFAGKKSRVKKAQGKFMSFDAAASTIVVNEKGKERPYKVKPEGSILTRTAVKINGLGAKITDLPAEARIIVYWLPDEADKKQRFARTIDAPSIPKDLEAEFD